MIDTLWNLNNEVGVVTDQPFVAGELAEVPHMLLSNGFDTVIATEEHLKTNAENVTQTLKPQTWEHVTLLESGGSDEDLSHLVNLLMLQCMDITAKGVVPFELLPETLEGNIKTTNVSLGDAHGYWTRAVAVLDTMDDDADEPKLVIKVMLSGVLFTGKFEEEDITLTGDSIGDTLTVIPRFAHPDGDDTKIDAVSFDVKLK